MAKITLDVNISDVYFNDEAVDEVHSNGILVWSKTVDDTLYELSYYVGIGTAPEPQLLTQGSKVYLADSSSVNVGALPLVGWSDGISFYSCGEQYTMPAHNVVMTAIWQGEEYIAQVDMPKICGYGEGSMPSIDGSYETFAEFITHIINYKNRNLGLDPVPYPAISFSLPEYTIDTIPDFVLDANPEWWEWIDLYNDATQNATTKDEQLVLMARAEAALLQQSLFLPICLNGGNYAISCLDVNSCLATEEPISAGMHSELSLLYDNLCGTGEYLGAARQKLVDAGYTLKDSVRLPYTRELTTLDIHNNPTVSDLRILKNLYYAILPTSERFSYCESYEFDEYGEYAVLHVREGMVWVDNQGRQVANFCADDFVAGLQHALDCGNTKGIVGVIANACEYVYGDITDFSDVGIESDGTTLTFSFVMPISEELFIHLLETVTGYLPLCRAYYVLQGGKFGIEYDPAASDYTYGQNYDGEISESHMAYSGDFLFSAYTNRNIILLERNQSHGTDSDGTGLPEIQTITYHYDELTHNRVSDLLDQAIGGYYEYDFMYVDYAFKNNAGIYADLDDKLFLYGVGDVSLMLVFSGLFAEENGDFHSSHGLIKNHTIRSLVTRAINRNNLMSAWSYSLPMTNTLSQPQMDFLQEDITVDRDGTDYTINSGASYEQFVQFFLDQYSYNSNCTFPSNDPSLAYDGWYDTNAASEYLTKLKVELLGDDKSVHLSLAVIGDDADSHASTVANVIKQNLMLFGIFVDIYYVDNNPDNPESIYPLDPSEYDMTLCYCRTPRMLQ